uniref:Uncharacterized protein n=1 Tax=Helicotheca tamesis TaxID=374047 RepID=A0A7S2MI20_9STRA|mmetsp:Transcript_16430/g.22530  ORF Transcript_16430/g.22530 Transcript_16430/m.22530 type:complete len:124 (+) Transcript_16430:704-1075(+)
MEKNVQKMEKTFENMLGTDGKMSVPRHELETKLREFTQSNVGILSDFIAYGDSIHIREHAMLALIPLMQHLSSNDSKKLVYSAFVDPGRNGANRGFSDNHFGKYSFNHRNIPCGLDKDLFSVS